jgi:hypothetical protein
MVLVLLAEWEGVVSPDTLKSLDPVPEKGDAHPDYLAVSACSVDYNGRNSEQRYLACSEQPWCQQSSPGVLSPSGNTHSA